MANLSFLRLGAWIVRRHRGGRRRSYDMSVAPCSLTCDQGVTHSVCTLEFNMHNEAWLEYNVLGMEKPLKSAMWNCLEF